MKPRSSSCRPTLSAPRPFVFGVRPIEMISLSNTAFCASPLASTNSTVTSFLPGVIAPILQPRLIFKPCLMNSFDASLAICSSTAPRKTGRPSSTVTSEPRRRQTLPISRPITPAPMTPSLAGTASMVSAPVFDRISFSSNGAPGNSRAFEPVAMTTCLAVRVSLAAPVTLMSYVPAAAAAKAARPWKKAILFFLNRYRMPSLFCLTTVSLRLSIWPRFSFRPATSMPCSAKLWPACSKCSDDCSSAFDGMQPTLVQVPPGAAPPLAFDHSSTQATEKPSCAARMAAM